MELMYPIVIVICVIFGLAIFFINFNNDKKYIRGKKVANTQYINETDYYKSKIKKYKILSNLVKILSAICIVTVGVLVARPITIQSRNDNKYNRDIIIGMDISTSQCEVNLELVKKFRSIMPNIKGDRIGIVLYNTAPVVYCPLTEDYEYVNECLDTIERQLDLVVKNNGEIPYNYDPETKDTETLTFWYGGTVTDSDRRGSSLVGDGLARNSVFISKFKKR